MVQYWNRPTDGRARKLEDVFPIYSLTRELCGVDSGVEVGVDYVMWRRIMTVKYGWAQPVMKNGRCAMVIHFFETMKERDRDRGKNPNRRRFLVPRPFQWVFGHAFKYLL